MFLRILNLTSNLCRVAIKPRLQFIVRSMATEEQDVIFEDNGDQGIIILNRPKALNALNLAMIRKLQPCLEKWECEKKLVIIKGAGEKAFCAGGDVRAVVEAGKKGDRLGHDFFREEYTLNCYIGSYKIPYIALIDGITMGGGAGLSMHGAFRVATERTLFAMPETQIGLFSDVGSSYFLSRLKGALGPYLALTGYRLKGADVLKAGLATHYCKSEDLECLEQDLLKCCNKSDVTKALNKYKANDGSKFSLEPVMPIIDKCFAEQTVEDILNKLYCEGSKWSEDTICSISKMSPTSLKLVLKELLLAKEKTLTECLQMEYRLAVNCLANKDFYEGVRALLIDKDQKPQWNPPNLCAVTDKIVNKYFDELPEGETDLELCPGKSKL